MNMNSLSTLKVSDLEKAGTNTAEFKTCPAGTHLAKVISFTEEENYNFISLEIDKVKYNFFYSYTLKDSDQLNADVINWILALSTIPVTPDTHLLEITNSAIGRTYEVEIRNYTSKTGKHAGELQHSIDFKVKPTLSTVEVSSENVDVEDFPF